jgi:hypothetical protein
VICGWTADASAQRMDTVALHGFGGWAYGKTDNENQYLVGHDEGNYDNVNFSLNISANPYERLSLYIQAGYTESRDEDDVGLDYAFAEWYFSDMLTFRVGKVKAPFMLYTEVYDVGTIRPFFTLPQGVYRQFAAEAYKGVGITGSLYTKHGWELQYDMYGGKLSLLPNLYIDIEEFRFDVANPVGNDLIGGRLKVQTPLPGLNVAFSAYTGEFEFEQEELPIDDRYIFIGASAEYLSDRLRICSEYLTQKESSKIVVDVVYVEAAYRFTDHWQAAARYEFADFEIDDPYFQYSPESLFEHEEIVLGLNYWLNPNLVFKCSYHIVDGNRFAFPENIQDYLESFLQGSFEETTHLILLGAQFSF